MGVDYMNGWDAMVATSQANVNSALQLAYNDNLLPHSVGPVSFTIPVFGYNIPASVTAQLSAWQLSGGSGKNVVISIPFGTGTLTVGNTSYPTAG